MQRRTLLVLLATAVFSLHGFIAAAAPADAPDPLWQKAVAAVTAHRDLIPGNIFILSEDLDGKGKVKTTEETRLHCFLSADNQVRTEILKVITNGKDVTAERQEQAKKAEQNQKKNPSAKKDEGVNLNVELPFDGESQSQVKYKPLNRAIITGKDCLSYDYTYAKDEKNTFQGTAWLDAETGLPIQIRYTPSPLPKYVSRMSTAVVFAYQADGGLESLQIKMEGAGGFLLFKKNMRITMKCTDYWKYAGKVN